MRRLAALCALVVLAWGAAAHADMSADPSIDGPGDVTVPAVRISAPEPTVPAPQWVRFDCESFKHYFDDHDLPWDFFAHVIQRESHCDPDAFYHAGRDWSFGLGQINTRGANWGELQWRCGLDYREQLFDPATNVSCIAAMYAAYGRRPWLT